MINIVRKSIRLRLMRIKKIYRSKKTTVIKVRESIRSSTTLSSRILRKRITNSNLSNRSTLRATLRK